VRLRSLLAQPGIHVLLRRDAEDLEPKALGPYVFMHRLTSEPGAGLVAVRPDGYMASAVGSPAVASWARGWRASARVARNVRVRNQLETQLMTMFASAALDMPTAMAAKCGRRIRMIPRQCPEELIYDALGITWQSQQRRERKDYERMCAICAS
jgi:hypothetical protein